MTILMLVLGTALGETPADAADAVLTAAARHPACALKRHGADAVRTAMALLAFGEAEQARACLLHSLTGKAENSAPAWAMAAAVFHLHPSLISHARALLRKKPCSRSPAAYSVLGPLPIGKNEVDGDPLDSHGGALVHWLRHHNATSKGNRL